MGVEPTAACSAQPATDFEDRGIHRDTTTPQLLPLDFNRSYDELKG
jgi:hypothetical protein